MVSFIIALSGDIFAFVIIRKGWSMIREPQQKMIETVSDYATRRYTGYGICLFGVLAIIANHYFF